MLKTFFVQTMHPVPEYADMFVEAECASDAEAIAERITGAQIWGSHEFDEPYHGDLFTEDFVIFLDSKTGSWH